MNGPGAHPLYKFLKDVQPAAGPGAPTRPNGDVAWNYEKVGGGGSGLPASWAGWAGPCLNSKLPWHQKGRKHRGMGLPTAAHEGRKRLR